MARWSFANVLDVTPDSRQLWQFSAREKGFPLLREHRGRNGEPVPDHWFSKDWSSLWQPRLNIAWLPVEKVFLRVLQLPAADFSETLSMVEFQLEKISPLPVAQIVWTIEVLPKREGGMQTVIVVIVPCELVEEFLGKLEGQGYLADRLELALVDQLLATPVHENGVWIYPGETNTSPCLVAWWYDGVLRNLTLLTWGNGNEGARLREQISQMAWAGELEGWLTTPPNWHVVADSATAATWENLLREWVDGPIEIVPPVPQEKLAALSAKRAVISENSANLLPHEYGDRYRHQFVDRLWMRGLGGILVLYIAVVIGYFSALQVYKFKLGQVQQEVRTLKPQHTTTIQLKERVDILQEQANLKFAALESWKMISDQLPEELTITSLNFQKGKTVMLSGAVSQDNISKLTEYYGAVGRSLINGQPVELGPLSTPPARPNAAGTPTVYWSFVIQMGEKGAK